MSIRVALHHETVYRYERPISLGPQIVRLRPAPHGRTPVLSYSLKVSPKEHFVNWQQDPQGNFLARLVFPEKADHLSIEVDLIAEMTVINPFDFFLEDEAENYPFQYEPWLARDLAPYLETLPNGPLVEAYLPTVDVSPARTVIFLVKLNQQLQRDISYTLRMDHGVQTPEETLTLRSGSCRDSAWLMIQILRKLGLAARFVSGYLIQLTADQAPLDGPGGPTQDFTDLHAWAEVFLPGAGWVGLDPTSGLFAGEGHIPLAATPEPSSAAPISGLLEPCETKFHFAMSVERVHEDPRVTKPYTDEQWKDIEALGAQVDNSLEASDVRLTMGGEPTFVSVDDMEGAEWNIAAMGPDKRRMGNELLLRIRERLAKGGLLHYGQGKWYPGEQLPRWALACYWRKDGAPLWNNPALFADDNRDYGHGAAEAQRFITKLAENLHAGPENVVAGYEDVWHFLWRERRLPANVDPFDSKVDEETERARLARVFERGLSAVVGFALPLAYPAQSGTGRFAGGKWFFRQERMYLVPGDSPMGLRLPLEALPWVVPDDQPQIFERDPLELRGELPVRAVIHQQAISAVVARAPQMQTVAAQSPWNQFEAADMATMERAHDAQARANGGGEGWHGAGQANGNGEYAHGQGNGHGDPLPSTLHSANVQPTSTPHRGEPAVGVIRTALCVEARQGRVHVFMPPAGPIEDYLALISVIETTASELQMPIVIEGYTPPYDPRIDVVKVTPDPGVIEINVQPVHSWPDLVSNTTALYEEARQSRLCAEKFMLDGRHAGTGGGNHIVLGGLSPADSPLLRRPDLLRSLVAYWQNHPSLSYLFSGLFIGPTSQAPRVDEARHESLYELETAFAQTPASGYTPPWLVDRLFRNLLVDLTGNTHRAEFCIDKLYSPDSASGRLGLVEFRGFEMPPHARMSLMQQLLLRAIIAHFWKEPYQRPLVRWGSQLHDRFMLPHFVEEDFEDVLADLRRAGFPFRGEWFKPHFEFRFPVIGAVTQRGVQVELRQAIEPWHVLGEEATAGGQARYVDSSVERMQVKVSGMIDPRYAVTCNGYRVPLHPTGTVDTFVAGVRYRAWQPPSCLHPTIPIHAPLVFDIVDTWLNRSLGGCTYYVSHPGGLSYATFPVNAAEAESRRSNRFFQIGHTGGRMDVPPLKRDADYPFTLDLRRASALNVSEQLA